MKQQLNDEQLLELIQLNKDSGFRILMQMYQEQVYWHIRRMVTYHEDADDVVQNTFIKVYRAIDRFKGDSKIYTWIYRIATNESLTFLKKRSSRKVTSMDKEEDSAIYQLKADEHFDGNHAELVLHQAILTLPEKQKTVFNLRYFEEMSYNEMSEVLETSVGALKASYHHAVKKVEQFINAGK